MKNRQWLLARRPLGTIQDSDFNFVETDVPALGEHDVVVRNLLLSCDPTQRGWIARDTYLPAVKIGEVVRSGGAGRIVASNNPDFSVGDIVSGLIGWQDYAVMTPVQLRKLPSEVPLELAMSALGLTGITAYFGLIEVGRPVAGETVVISGALLSSMTRSPPEAKKLGRPEKWSFQRGPASDGLGGRRHGASTTGQRWVPHASGIGRRGRVMHRPRQPFRKTLSAFLSILPASALDMRPALTAWLARALALRACALFSIG
jgi:hypothetical protein